MVAYFCSKYLNMEYVQFPYTHHKKFSIFLALYSSLQPVLPEIEKEKIILCPLCKSSCFPYVKQYMYMI